MIGHNPLLGGPRWVVLLAVAGRDFNLVDPYYISSYVIVLIVIDDTKTCIVLLYRVCMEQWCVSMDVYTDEAANSWNWSDRFGRVENSAICVHP